MVCSEFGTFLMYELADIYIGRLIASQVAFYYGRHSKRKGLEAEDELGSACVCVCVCVWRINITSEY